MKTKTLAAVYGLLLTGFSAYVLLDTFVLTRTVQTGTKEMNLSLFAGETTDESSTADVPAQTAVSDAAKTAVTQQSGQTTAAAPADGTETGNPESGEEAESGTEPVQSAGRTVKTLAPSAAGGGNTAAKSEQSTTAKPAPATTQPAATQPPATTAPATEPPVQEPAYLNDDSHYQDDNISIELSEYSFYDTSVYVADIQLSSVQYLKTAFANDTYGYNVTAKTSKIASEHDAILAINGDFYGTHTHGYVIRNGVLYRDVPRDNTDFLCIMADGSFFLTTSAEHSAQELLDMGTWQCFMFGPRLIENGSIAVDENSEVARSMASNPRTAIGMIDSQHYLFVVSDGRTSESDGLSLSQLAEFMQGLGAYTAYNLDGGGSSTMYFNGNVINNPTTSGRSIKERSVSDIVYIGY